MLENTHLCHLKLHPTNCLSVSNSQVRREGGMSDDGCECVPVLMSQPLTIRDVSTLTDLASRANLLFRQVSMPFEYR